ncbi:OmpW family outer membrane protein [Pasteurella multocida]|uniref:OmpW family outer membrane protein n=1 Tax=Pasteurella multocida TaxID=747 RepID=UPI00021455D0|nr:OmpW family outer membrane protein [Pasteurella multocida]EGP02150.1 OmpW [Pasteurella multocida subsp. gallicida str. Anand1_poultry]AFF23606.1 outer membrane protein [Pasteurella multocida subsp. multocida str. HN06]MCL7775945.1 outer membrane beta-barrel protein [Pasteurella multocida]MCL8064690.1 outer membrane beta-barrel protein [Pasteurella multocida]MCL8065664.1 outer membrane beta-barrel protein [Pasteurella multocida]
MKKTVLALGVMAALVAGSAVAHQAGSVIVRGGPILVVPNASTNHDVFKFDVNSNAQLGLTATYMATDNLGVELLAATPFSHEITLGNTLVGKTKHLPPSLYAQYYFLDKDAKARPYVGAGVNYTTFFSEKAVLNGVTDLKLKDSWGPAFNAGVDIQVADNLFLNTAIWYAKIKSKATFKLGGEEHKVNVKLDPTVFFVGLGYRF